LKKVYVVSTYSDAQIIPTLPASMLKFKAECKIVLVFVTIGWFGYPFRRDVMETA
jgi:hypothetical protein